MKTILLIEDHPEMRENTAEILELAGYQVVVAENGKKGVDLAVASPPDMVICDVMMPVLDGYGVLHILSKNPKTSHIPFIFLTAKSEKEDFRKGMNLGADDYITKPFSESELLDAIAMRFEKSAALRKEIDRSRAGLEDFMNRAESFDALIRLTGERKSRTYKKKEVVFSEGSYPNSVFLVNSGSVKTYKVNEDGKEYITGIYKAGDFLGYTAVLEDGNYTESASAMEESELCPVTRQDFLTLLYSNREVANKFIKLLSDNVHDREERLLSLAYNSVRKRVAEALLMLRNRNQSSDQPTDPIHISREDLSNIVGTATESLIRTLSDFKDEGMIELRAGQVKILDPRKLEHMKF